MVKKEKIEVEISVASKSLNVKNPKCPNGHLLVSDEKNIGGFPSIKVNAKIGDREGIIFLDPVYGSYGHIYDSIEIKDGEITEFFCPECGTSLTDKHENCRLCSSPLFVFQLPKGSIAEGCLKKGCHFHKIRIVDSEEQMSRHFEDTSTSTLESFL